MPNIVIGLAANKSDLFDKEQVSEPEARQYADEIGAIFKLTSACTAAGIEDLFKIIGCKFLDPNYKEDEDNSGGNTATAEAPQTNVSIKLDPSKIKKDKKKKGCC